jgi:3-deoxy-7-phosphoheptulonate synthase
MINQIHNTNIESETVITSPIDLREQVKVSDYGKDNILTSRKTVDDIFLGKDKRLIVIVGPCSIHDINAAKEYALKLKLLQKEVEESIYIMMRVYFEKPRTTVGWKGLISDPDMDDSLDVEKGLRQGRELLVWLAEQEYQLRLRRSIRLLLNILLILFLGVLLVQGLLNRKLIVKCRVDYR